VEASYTLSNNVLIAYTSPWAVYFFVNNRSRKPKRQTKIDNPDKLATSGIQDTDDDQQKKKTTPSTEN